MRLPGFSRMHGDQYAIDGVGPIEGSLILGLGEGGPQHRLDVLQRCFRKVLLLGDRTQHATGVHGAEFPQAKLPDAVAKVIATDFVMALARAGPTLLFCPRQVSSFDEGGQRYSRICTEPIAIDGCMNDARHRSTSKMLEKSLERPNILEMCLTLLEPFSCEVRWRYRTYHEPWSLYR